jgi:Trypsin-like peptidase domain
LTIDDFRRGVVRICDGEGSSRGTGFFVSQSGHVLTCNHVTEDAHELSVTLVDGRRVPARLAPELSLPELDFAVLHTDITPEFVIPIEFAGAVGDQVWASGFQMQGQVTDALPTMGRIAGKNGLEYSYNDRDYRLPEVLRLEGALVEPGVSGGCAALFPDAVAIGVVNAMLKDKGGFILPFHAIQDRTCGLCDLLQQNRKTVARYGTYVNWPAIRDLCRKSSSQTLAGLKTKGQYATDLFVRREAVESVLHRFLSGSSRILPLVGQTGTGKTSCAAFMTEYPSKDFTTLLLLAYRLSPQPGGLATSLAGNLSNVSNSASFSPGLSSEMPALTSASVTRAGVSRAIAESSDGDLIILLDGLNELPGAINVAREWIEDTCEWLRRNENVRLIVTCRPEYWDSAKGLFAEDLLYAEPLPASGDKPQREGDEQSLPQAGEKLFRLEDFTEEEAAEASRRYGFPIKEAANIFRHPLLYNIARGALRGSTTVMPSTDQLFMSYVNAAVQQIGSKQERPNGFMLRATLEGLANTLRCNKSFWIERRQFLDAFSGAPSMMGALLDEHLLMEGEGGVRFAFDEIAYYLVAQAASKEFERKAAGEIDWSGFRREDPIGADSMSFFLASLETRGKSEAVAGILNSLASQSHAGQEVKSYALQALFVRLLRWLRAPSAYFATILAFAESCTSETDWRRRHSLVELADLPGISPLQQMQLLALMARRESDREYRWKDWEKLSELDFWNRSSYRPGVTSFRLAVRKVLQRDPVTAIAALLEWLKDKTRLDSSSPPSEATVSDLACSFLYHSATRHLDRIVDGVAALRGLQNADNLLTKLIGDDASSMVDVCERWAQSGAYEPLFRVRVVGALLSMRLESKLVGRLLPLLDMESREDSSPEVEAAIAASLAGEPSTALRALAIVEKLVQKGYPVSPWLLRSLISFDTDRVLPMLDFIIVHSEDKERREWAVTALEELTGLPDRVPVLLAMLESYLDRYPELVYEMARVIEELFYHTAADTPEAAMVDAWVRERYLKFAADKRTPIIYGIFSRAEKSSQGLPLLHDVIAVESLEGKLGSFLQLIPSSRLSMKSRLELLTIVTERIDKESPGGESILATVLFSHDDDYGQFLAETVAKDATRWSTTVVEYSRRVLAGETPFEVADELSWRGS